MYIYIYVNTPLKDELIGSFGSECQFPQALAQGLVLNGVLSEPLPLDCL